MPEIDLKADLDRLRWNRRNHPGRGQRQYASTARAVRLACEDLILRGHADEAVPLLRKAVDRMTRCLMYLDDSSGVIGEQLRLTMATCANACEAAPPNPRTLATWLVKLECDGPGWPDVRLQDFAAGLGRRGLAEIERQVEERAKAADPGSWRDNWALRDLRKQLAQVSGDVDRYVAVVAQDLTHAGKYEDIAKALATAGRVDEAIGWARRGVAEKATHAGAGSLRDLLVSLLVQQGQPEAAVATRKDDFDREPRASAYQAWAATAASLDQPDPLPYVLRILRGKPSYAGELITVLQANGNHDEAWKVAPAIRGNPDNRQWVSVLAARARTHPGDVIQPFQELLEDQVLDSYDRRRYERAVVFLPPLRDAYAALGRPEEFASYVSALRKRHRSRPKFIALLDGQGWR